MYSNYLEAEDNEAKIKSFLLKYKKKYQELLNKNITANCFRCPIHEINDLMPHGNCTKAYEYISTLLGKEPKKSVIRTDAYCKDVYKEMISLASSVIETN